MAQWLKALPTYDEGLLFLKYLDAFEQKKLTIEDLVGGLTYFLRPLDGDGPVARSWVIEQLSSLSRLGYVDTTGQAKEQAFQISAFGRGELGDVLLDRDMQARWEELKREQDTPS